MTIAINNLNEKRRADRDFVTKAFETPRDDIKRAVDAALAYFPLASDERTKKLEAQILAAEREVRRSITSVTSLHDLADDSVRSRTTNAFDDFIAALTSGSFQAKTAEADLATAVKIADAGGRLRAALIELRSSALKQAIANDPITLAGDAWAGLRRSIGR